MYKKYLLTSILCSFSMLPCMQDLRATLSSATDAATARSLLLAGAPIDIRHSNDNDTIFEQAFINQDRQTLGLILRKSYPAATADAIAQALILIRSARTHHEKTTVHYPS